MVEESIPRALVPGKKRLEQGAISARIPSLDGIRAVAILINIGGHIVARYGWPHTGTASQKLVGRPAVLFWGGDGVGIFFVLSGFLITTLLLREYKSKNTISLGKFYVRRAYRILPPLYVYILFVIGFCAVDRIHYSISDITSAALFYRDYYFKSTLWLTEHLWTLSVEEQFYLLWPVVLLITLRWRGRTTAIWVTFILILVTPVLRIGGSALHIAMFRHHTPWMFHTRMDSLMSGCMVALLSGTNGFERLYNRFRRYWWLLPLYFWCFSYSLDVLLYPNFMLTIGFTLDSICIALFIVWATRNEGSLFGRILNSRPFVQMGILSYSAYLWQTFFTNISNTTILGRMPFAFFYIWVVAWLSYKFVEQPALRLRDRMQSARAKKE
jgi:peptidoglycan/LPS O-acetylase OafA/YrhL